MKYKYIICLVVTLAISGCGEQNSEGPAAGPEMPVSAVLARAVREPVQDRVQVVGSLSARDEVKIISELDSTVTAVVVKEGQKLKKGEKLFQLDDVKTSALLSEAEAAYKLAELSHKRNEGLLKNDTISQQTYDEAEAELKSKKARLELSKDDQSKTVISAPFDGMAGEKSVSVGQFVSRGKELLNLVGIDPLDIVGDVPERYTARLSTGLVVEFKTEAYPGKVFKASVVYVSPSVDTSSRTVRIKAEVPNGERLLRPGMFGKMSIVLGVRADSLLIPESCIQMQGAGKMVVRVNGESRTELTPITTGKRSKGRVEVLSGLSEGDLVVVEGWQKTGPGSLVMAAPESEAYGVTPAAAREGDDDNL